MYVHLHQPNLYFWKKEDFVKLAFRNGGANAFYDKMKQAMTAKEWEVSHELRLLN